MPSCVNSYVHLQMIAIMLSNVVKQMKEEKKKTPTNCGCWTVWTSTKHVFINYLQTFIRIVGSFVHFSSFTIAMCLAYRCVNMLNSTAPVDDEQLQSMTCESMMKLSLGWLFCVPLQVNRTFFPFFSNSELKSNLKLVLFPLFSVRWYCCFQQNHSFVLQCAVFLYD